MTDALPPAPLKILGTLLRRESVRGHVTRLGVKAHWRDADAMARLAREAAADTLEVHLAPRDVGADAARVLDAFRPLGRDFRLVVHQPEWSVGASGEALFVNPAADDESWRRASVDALVAAAALSRKFGAAGLIVHPGGVEAPHRAWRSRPEALSRSLVELREREPGVPLWLENMPWFYGFRDGTVGRATLGTTPAALAAHRDSVDGFCLDFCHAFLSAPPPGGGWGAVAAFLDALGDDVRHAHASGARHLPAEHPNPREGEGVPFGEGDMDAATYARALSRLRPDAAVVPEIDRGFAEDGRGFRDGLTWLRALSVTGAAGASTTRARGSRP